MSLNDICIAANTEKVELSYLSKPTALYLKGTIPPTFIWNMVCSPLVGGYMSYPIWGLSVISLVSLVVDLGTSRI